MEDDTVIERKLLPTVDRSLPIALVRAREKVMAPIREMLIDTGITEQQWRVLRVLSEMGAIDASRLADKACLLAPSLTRILHSMIEKKLVTREIDVDDRRRQLISITESGQAILDSKTVQALAIGERIGAIIGEEQHELLLDLLAKLDDV